MSVKDTLKKKVAPVMAAAALLTPVATQASEQNAPETREQTIEQKIEQGKAEQLAKFNPVMKKFAPEIAKNARKFADKIDAKNVGVFYRDDGYIQVQGIFENENTTFMILDPLGNEVKNVQPIDASRMEGMFVHVFESGNYFIDLNDKTFQGVVVRGNLNTGEVNNYGDVRNVNEIPKKLAPAKELDPVDKGKAQMLRHFKLLLRGTAPEMAKQASKWADKYDAFKRCGDENGDVNNISILFRKDGYIQITSDMFKERARFSVGERDENGKVSGNFVILDMNGNEVKDVMPNRKAEGIQVLLNKDGKYEVEEVTNRKDGTFIQSISEGKVETKDYAKTIENIGQKAEDIAKLVHNGVLGR